MSDREKLEKAIAALEAQRSVLDDAVFDLAINSLKAQIRSIEEAPSPTSVMKGERKKVTIVFADVSGFTAMSESMDPELIRDLMNSCFDTMVPIIDEYQGTVDKYIGDEIMALFGAPMAHENDPELALHCSLEMLSEIESFNAEHDTNLGLHFGINTGLVIAGQIGSKGKRDYSVMGDAVNLASRLEDLSSRGEILVGSETHRLTAHAFDFAEAQEMRISGKSEKVPVYRLLGSKPEPGSRRGITGLFSPLVGRGEELAALDAAVEELKQGRCGLAGIIGDAGLGKSRLVRELTQRHSELTWATGRTQTHTAEMSYWLLRDLVRDLLGVPRTLGPEEAEEHIRSKSKDVRFGRDPYPFFSKLLDLSEGEGRSEESMRPQEFEEGLLWGIREYLAHLTAASPVAIVLEDLHWADSVSLDLLQRLFESVRELPVLFLLVFRPARQEPIWGVHEALRAFWKEQYLVFKLRPLTLSDTMEMVRRLLLCSDFPDSMARLIEQKAEGNPFYVEELIRTWIDSGSIVLEGGRIVSVGAPDSLDIPDRIQDVIMSRIDRLPDKAKHTLQSAAVIGRVFQKTILSYLYDKENESKKMLDSTLAELVRREFVRYLKAGSAADISEYIFDHAIVNEVAYNSLLIRERRRIHGLIGGALESLFPDRCREMAGTLAHHFSLAGEAVKAVKYLSWAGDRARSVYVHAEAIDYFQRALYFLGEGEGDERAARLYMKLGMAYQESYHFRKAHEAFQKGFATRRRLQRVTLTDALPPPAPHPYRQFSFPPMNLDPAFCDEVYSGEILKNLFSGLVQVGPGLELIPDVAESWEILENGRKYVFHLRDDVKWTNDEPVTARDFVYAWKRLLDPHNDSGNADLLFDIRGASSYHRGLMQDDGDLGIRAFDDRTLVVALAVPAAYFLHIMALSVTRPVCETAVEEYGEDWTAPVNIVTCGPFVLKDWEPGKRIVLNRNHRYHGRYAGNIEEVDWQALTAANEDIPRERMWRPYDLDEVDFMELAGNTVRSARDRYPEDYTSSPYEMTLFVAFYTEHSPFEDRRIRQAFASVIDSEAFLTAADQVDDVPATGGFIPPGIPAHSPGIALPYDPEKAKDLLRRTGYPDGRGFPVVTMAALRIPGDASDTYFSYFQDQLRNHLGIRLELEIHPWQEHVELLQNRPHNIGMFFNGWRADYPDPDNFLRSCSTILYTGWRDAEYQSLVSEARQIPNREKRLTLYRQADRMLIEQAVVIPLAYPLKHHLTKPWIKTVADDYSKEISTDWKNIIIEPH